MAGEHDLDRMLARLDPVLHPEELVCATVPSGEPVPAVDAFALITEAEGTTLILAADHAVAHGLIHDFPCRRIELRVVSDLAAVGLTAAVAGALTDAGLSANLVAGFHHDHVLVATATAERALAVLSDLASPPPAEP